MMIFNPDLIYSEMYKREWAYRLSSKRMPIRLFRNVH